MANEGDPTNKPTNKTEGKEILQKTPVLVSGLPGKMATAAAKAIKESEDFALFEAGFSSQKRNLWHSFIGNQDVVLISPHFRQAVLGVPKDFLIVDYSNPSVVNENARDYVKGNRSFVVGTTGGDQKEMEKIVKDSEVCAVIAPNMGKQIVAFQEHMVGLSKKISLKDCELSIFESHQKGKKDTSGTAKAMVEYFNLMGIPFSKEQIIQERDPVSQNALGVPEKDLTGHGWHTYVIRGDYSYLEDGLRGLFKNSPAFKGYSRRLFFDGHELGDPQFGVKKPRSNVITNLELAAEKIGRPGLLSKFNNEYYVISPDDSVAFSLHESYDPKLLVITHNVNGRNIYAQGTLDALRFLKKKTREGESGEVYSMIDVLRDQEAK